MNYLHKYLFSLYSKNPEYATSQVVLLSQSPQRTNDSFSSVIEDLYENDIVQEYLYTLVKENKESIDNEMNI